MILPNPLGLNVHLRYQIDKSLPYLDANHENIGEISRMAIAPRYRRRDEDRGNPIKAILSLKCDLKKMAGVITNPSWFWACTGRFINCVRVI